tara:strand:+ start:28917 stop:29582 length:666 start_codon:yes stop_codon:yes gene_type:complete
MYGRRIKDDIRLGQAEAKLLADALKQGNIDARGVEQEKFIQFIELMIKWNRAYNLTSVRDPKQIIARHIMDSLAIMPWVTGQNILDIGTGAGLPGIPLAIMLPDTEFVLLDSNGKKCRFLVQAIRELQLDNVSVVKERVEEYFPGHKFDQIVSRAFSSISDMVLLSHHLCASDGDFMAMKGIYPQAEMADIPNGYRITGAHALEVPGLDGERNLITLKFED